jgi:hypothetical protein
MTNLIGNLQSLPEVSAVYRVWFCEGLRGEGCDRVVYVGQARNLRQRWQRHHILPELIARYGLNWTIDWVEISPPYLDRAEAFAYRYFMPELNQQNPSVRLGAEFKG